MRGATRKVCQAGPTGRREPIPAAPPGLGVPHIAPGYPRTRPRILGGKGHQNRQEAATPHHKQNSNRMGECLRQLAPRASPTSSQNAPGAPQGALKQPQAGNFTTQEGQRPPRRSGSNKEMERACATQQRQEGFAEATGGAAPL